MEFDLVIRDLMRNSNPYSINPNPNNRMNGDKKLKNQGDKKLDKKLKDPCDIFPKEMIEEIFSHLTLKDIRNCCLVCKNWKKIASNPLIWKKAIYKEIAFSNEKWIRHFGKDIIEVEDNAEEFKSLPDDIASELKTIYEIFEEKERRPYMLVRIPKTLKGTTSLTSLGELLKRHFPKNENGYKYLWAELLSKKIDLSIEKSYWVLMTDLLPESKNKKYVEQQEIVAKLAQDPSKDYIVCTLIEIIICHLARYLSSKTLKDELIQCQFNDQLVTICLASDGFEVDKGVDVIHQKIGISASRILSWTV